MKTDKKSTVTEEDIDRLMEVFSRLSPLDLWSRVKRDDFTVRRFAGGFLSDIACCELTLEARSRLFKSARHDLPAVVVKYSVEFGTFPVNRLESATAQVLMASLGITPRITYFGEKCTISEFVPSGPYGHEDDHDPKAVEQVVRLMAQIHSLRPPISAGAVAGPLTCSLRERVEREKTSEVQLEVNELPENGPPSAAGALSVDAPRRKGPNFVALVEKQYMSVLAREPPEIREKYYVTLQEIDHLAIDDFNQRLKALVRSPMVYSHNDFNRGNRLIQAVGDQTGSKRIYLVDFDFSGFAPRGLDLGRFLSTFKHRQDVFQVMPIVDQLQHPLDFGQQYFPPDQELRALLEVYRAEAVRIQGPDFGHDPRNSIDSLMDEAKVYTLGSYDDFGFGLLQYGQRMAEEEGLGEQRLIYLDAAVFRYNAWKNLKTHMEQDGTIARLLSREKNYRILSNNRRLQLNAAFE